MRDKGATSQAAFFAPSVLNSLGWMKSFIVGAVILITVHIIVLPTAACNHSHTLCTYTSKLCSTTGITLCPHWSRLLKSAIWMYHVHNILFTSAVEIPSVVWFRGGTSNIFTKDSVHITGKSEYLTENEVKMRQKMLCLKTRVNNLNMFLFIVSKRTLLLCSKLT